MGWSEWPAWVKGGVIAVVIELILFILLLLLESLRIDTSLWIVAFPVSFILWGFVFGDNMTPFWFYLSYPLSVILWFIIGAIIGFIIGKIKSRNEVRYKNV
jgi:K+-sensing histidine kinase KdpD